eukprot:CAMPEP_0197541886 /NCGR_PEP_ID=MMETSP1318-20131121/67405_1 /TAXON_ID=552666 /ORGANISM="Partenskyella glossopodia, Strain RCC365" /LENGTH=229 /DNA_ID=CAMNT_0043101103 /DNA_START=1384 /DNA_END=2073 /DNA_ORIENTATION=+
MGGEHVVELEMVNFGKKPAAQKNNTIKTIHVHDAHSNTSHVVRSKRGSTRASISKTGDSEALSSVSRARLIFRHFAISGNRFAPDERKSIFEKKAASQHAQTTPDMMTKETHPGTRTSSNRNSNQLSGNTPHSAKRPIKRVPTQDLTPAEQLALEEAEERERRRQRMMMMEAVLNGTKRYSLFQEVRAKGKGNGVVHSKLVQQGPNKGKHKVKIGSAYYYVHPVDLEAC